MADNPKKRKKPDAPNASQAKRPRFPVKPHHNIKTTHSATAYPNGELSVSRFMRVHENEIKALEKAMQVAKKGLMRRAFQMVPKEMRRRTGSHNPQRVPKRLRARAKQEAKDDNTPISKNKSGSGVGKGGSNMRLRKEGIGKAKKAKEKRDQKKNQDVKVTITSLEKKRQVTSTEEKDAAVKTKKIKSVKLAVPDTPAIKWRKRQVHKSWLPTHIFHTKRARMTPPKEPLWRFAIPLTPAAKVYRTTHRGATLRGAVAWDTSYTSTISLEGVQASIIGLLKAMHFCENSTEDPWQEKGKGKKWRDGTRMWEGWLYEREPRPSKHIAEVAVIWCALGGSASSKRKAMIRVHPSAFLQLWKEVVKVSKIQKPGVTVEDLRFEIGSIEIMGPHAAETLCSILQPSDTTNISAESPQSVWSTLVSVTDTGVLPANSLIAFPISDPRLHDPPATANIPEDPASQDHLLNTLAEWPVDRTQITPAIFDRNARLAASRSLPSQQSINRRKGAAPPGEYPNTRSTDPHIPMLTFVSRRNHSWTVLLPWKCVSPVWRSIMRYPLSSGRTPMFAGFDERRQVDFERSEPQFPFDYPCTDAGWAWEMQQRSMREHEWTRAPKGKRTEWSTINLGNDRRGEVGDPWACQWERLLLQGEQDNRLMSTAPSCRQMLLQQVSAVLAGRSPSPEDGVTRLFTAKIVMVQRGVPSNCARIYRLPTGNAGLRQKWLSLMSSSPASTTKPPADRRRERELKDLPKHLQAKALAASLLEPRQAKGGQPKVGDADYPIVPDEADLIGFVTTGNYNLAEGKPTAVASLVLHKVLETSSPGSKARSVSKERHVTPRPLDSMSEDRAAGEQADGARAAVKVSPDALAALTHDIIEDALYNTIFRRALSCHRSEKLLRMQSAATQAESVALATLEPPSQVKSANSQPTAPAADTPAARYENGRVYLKGNPLKTTPEITCPHCKLPRLMHPIMGKGMQQPDLSKEYCMLYPWVQRQGHDVYGNPFPDGMAKSKKERELLKQQQKNAEKESVGTPGSQDTDMANDGNPGKETKLNTGGKPAYYVPWHTCPNCKRSLLITRFAQHLEKCIGISGRQSSRNAMAKLAGQNGNGTGMANTPLGSRMGTPAPGSQSDAVAKVKGKGVSPVKKLNDDDDDGENDTPERKKKKKSSYIKKADREKMAKEGITSGPLKVKLKANPNKESSRDPERKASVGSEKPDGKRDRDDTEGDGAPKAKKIKLSLSGGVSSANGDSVNGSANSESKGGAK
ncbi:hypothetical protein P154DRAFT_424849 [Amniculicola lignicola CBS 123094]|uniref:SAGA-associated factor 11 n=1 Tax=Amniculicola lignicola CBS 123094 TaxID=1392246 RepID=A0A6A5WWT1_9PLEO|nr:hypothetical protein P154DRAFT_424849 [Amniculicola lignicola CBS 123094]